MINVVIAAYPAVKRLPKAATAVCLHPKRSVAIVASDDRSLRMVELDSGRPVGAIVGLPVEVAAIAVDLSPMVTVDTEACQDWGSVWIACGAEAHQLRLSPASFLRTFAAALIRSVVLGSGKSDVNDLAMSSDGRSLGWCTDDGKVGVFDLTTSSKTAMKGKHANIAGSVVFIPSHPSTVLSTGYDSTARTWASNTGVNVDSLALDPPAGSATTMAPTFPLSLAVCALGSASQGGCSSSALAIGTADGALWLALPPASVGGGGLTERSAAPLTKEQKKKARRQAGGPWRGLGRLERVVLKGAGVEGSFVVGIALLPRPSSPAAAVVSEDNPLVLTLSHAGALRLWSVTRISAPVDTGSVDDSEPKLLLKQLAGWQTSSDLTKCNALTWRPCPRPGSDAQVESAGDGSRWEIDVTVAGFEGSSGAGAVESWRVGLT